MAQNEHVLTQTSKSEPYDSPMTLNDLQWSFMVLDWQSEAPKFAQLSAIDFNISQ